MNISFDSVQRVRMFDVQEYEDLEDDEERFFRRMVIETASGEIELIFNAESEEDLEIEEE